MVIFRRASLTSWQRVPLAGSGDPQEFNSWATHCRTEPMDAAGSRVRRSPLRDHDFRAARFRGWRMCSRLAMLIILTPGQQDVPQAGSAKHDASRCPRSSNPEQQGVPQAGSAKKKRFAMLKSLIPGQKGIAQNIAVLRSSICWATRCSASGVGKR